MERIFSFDTKIENGSILRFFKVRKKIDLLVLDVGTYPEQTDEIVLDKCYAAMHELMVGDMISIDSKPYLITGLGSVTDYDVPTRGISDYSSDSLRFGIAFLTDDGYEQLLSHAGAGTRQEYLYSYKLGKDNTDDDLRNEILALYGEDDSILTFVKRSNNGRMGRAVYDGFAYEIAGILGWLASVWFSAAETVSNSDYYCATRSFCSAKRFAG